MQPATSIGSIVPPRAWKPSRFALRIPIRDPGALRRDQRLLGALHVPIQVSVQSAAWRVRVFLYCTFSALSAAS